MPERAANGEGRGEAAPVRAFWSGTITFGLVSIPVDLFAAARPRQKSMKMVDKDGHPLGRQYHCSEDGKKLDSDDIVRGYETESGEMIVITDEEFEAVAPENSRDIELRRFVPLEQIPPIYFERPYFLAPSGRSAKAYNLLAQTMERTGQVAIGTFVMRGHEYLAAILSENGVLRAETLRHAAELRTPDYVGLPARAKAPSRKVTQFIKEIDALTEDSLNMAELEDRDAEALQTLAQQKEDRGEDVIAQAALEDEEAEGGGQVIDLMEVLRKSLARNAVVTTARGANGDGGAQVTRLADRAREPRKESKRAKSTRGREGDLTRLTKSELNKMASKLDIAGRSKMDKKQLAAAIAAAKG